MINLKFETAFDYFIFFIILIKLLFIFFAIGSLFISHTNNEKAKSLEHTFLYWKHRLEFIFMI